MNTAKTTAGRVIPQWIKALRRSGGVWVLLGLLIPTLNSFAAADTGQWKVSSGFDYSSGDYDDAEKTTMLFVPFRVGYKQGNLGAKVSMSWISIDGPATVVDGGVVLPGGGASRRESGIGDTWVSVTYDVEAFPYEIGFLDVTGKLKIPTADEEKGLGTGEFDEALYLDYMYPLGRLTPMASLAYKRRGDPPGVDLNNTMYLSLGADWRQTPRLNLGATLDYQQATVQGVADPLDLFTYVSYKAHEMVTVTPYLYFGLSQASPDIGGGIQITLKP